MMTFFLVVTTSCLLLASAFHSPVITNIKTTVVNRFLHVSPSSSFNTNPRTRGTHLGASSAGSDSKDLFKAGLLANMEDEAAELASKKIRSVADLGWKDPSPRRRGNTRPRHWAFGGAGEKAIQDKPNYDPTNPLCVEKWLSLSEFYAIVGDQSAVADTIFVALAKGGAYIERQVAEAVIAQWRPTRSSSSVSAGGGMFGRKSALVAFDRDAFVKTVQEGRTDFLKGWAAFVIITGIAVAGIVFPTNPLQLALVDFLETVTHTEERMTVLTASKAVASSSLL
jgi:hypothetical protein